MSLKQYGDWYGSLFAISLAIGVLLFVVHAIIAAVRHLTNSIPF